MLPFLLRRLPACGLVLVTCLSLCGRADAARVWSAAAWARLGGTVATHPPGRIAMDIDADGDIDQLAVDHALSTRTVWENEHTDGLALFQISDRLVQPDLLRQALQPTPTDDSDSSDPSVRTESRAGPSVAQHAGAVPAVSPIAPRSRTFSSSTPRAPPAALRLA